MTVPTMKKIIILPMAAAILAASCARDINSPLPADSDGGYTLVLEQAQDATRARVDEITGKMSWSSSDPLDQVRVVTTEIHPTDNSSIIYDVPVKDASGASGTILLSQMRADTENLLKMVVFPASVYDDASGSLVLPDRWDMDDISGDICSAVMLGDVINNLPRIDMYFVTGMMRLSLGGIPAGTSSIVISTDAPLAGTLGCPSLTLNAGRPVIFSNGSVASFALVQEGAKSSVTVDPGSAFASAPGSVTLNIPLPAGSYRSLSVSALDAEGAFLAGASASGFNWVISRREGKKLTLALTDGPEGLTWDIPAVADAQFSVSSYNKVRFTNANLMYAGKSARAMGQSTPWRLMKYPWSMVETDDWDQAQQSGMGDISLFGFGTSGYSGKNPWMTSDSWQDYPSGTLDENTDWGRHNRVFASDGYSRIDNLRTPSSAEWAYLLGLKEDVNDSVRSDEYLFQKATVCDVPGLIIFPDGFTPAADAPAALQLGKCNDSDIACSANEYTYREFRQLAAAGVVFLPHAGSREGSSFIPGNPANKALYASSTSESGSGYYQLCFMDKDPEGPTIETLSLEGAFADEPSSVRLVQDDNLKPQPAYEPFTPERYPFSVAPGKEVLFTTSNLIYDGSQTGTQWRLQQHPWDLVEQSNWTASQRNGQGRISLFAWGTSGYNGRNPWLRLESSDQNWSWETENDWGRYNSIWTWDGSTSYSELRVLSKDEWDFLLNGESRGETRYAKAVVNGVCGLLIFPDNYSRGGIVKANSQSSSFADNIFTAEEFFTLSEYGVTFLPSAGTLDYTSSTTPGHYLKDAEMQIGRYWSSTNSSDAYCAWALSFDKYDVLTDGSDSYYNEGYSVRLVKDMEIPVSRITLEQGANLKMPVYESVQLTASVYPVQATDKTLIWGSEDENVASVDLTSGLLTAKGLGKTTIYCTNEASSVFATIEITVAYEPINQRGVFSVSPTKKVRFTSANLMYAGSTGTSSTRWRIMEFPWSMTAYAAGTVPSASSGYDVDLLPATSPYPWSNGIYDSEGEELLSGLSLLSETEWRYLLKQSDAIGDSFQNDEGRTDPIRFVEAKVNGVQGLIIFPDGFTSDKLYYIGGTSGSSKISQLWNLNVLRSSLNWNQGDGSGIYTLSCPEFSITDSQFHELAYQGAVFIPAAGYAQGGILTAREDVSSVSSMGPYVEGRGYFYYTNNPAYPFNWMIYWTSTGGTAASQAKVMNLCYRSAGSNSSPTYSYTEADRSLQRSVRLVQEVQN